MNTEKGLFLISFLGQDEKGEIVKGIEIMAESSEQAMDLVKQLSKSTEIYSAIPIKRVEDDFMCRAWIIGREYGSMEVRQCSNQCKMCSDW